MAQGLVEAAKRCELHGHERNKSMMADLSSLDVLLNDFVESQRPSPQDYENRRNVIRIFNEIAQEIYGSDSECPTVKEFGSFLMDMFTVKSDLDLSISFRDTADRVLQVKTLRKFVKKLHVLEKTRDVSNIQLILSARVPVVKVTHSATGVECDLSVGNSDGILKSQILLMICALDDRFKKLSLLMKAWAKAHGIDSAKDGTMNSLSLTLLAAFHLQTRDPPILPPFSAIVKDGVEAFLDYGESNKESLANLFVSLLIKLESVEPLWAEGLCASTHEGSWLNKKIGCITIEDFIDRSQNVSRALKSKKKGIIYSCIHQSIKHIRLLAEGKVDAKELINLLFEAHPVVLRKGSKKRKRKLRALAGRAQYLSKLDNAEDRHPAKFINPTPSNRGLTGIHNVIPTAYGGNFQGSWGVGLEGTLIEPLNQLISLLNVPIQGSGGLGHERTHAETFSLGASNHLASRRVTLPSQSVAGFGTQRSQGEHMNYAPPNFSAGQQHYFPRIPIQEYGGFRPDRTQVETYSPNYPVPGTYSPAFRSPSAMPPYQPHPHFLPPGARGATPLGWSHAPPPYPVPVPYGDSSYAVDNRGVSSRSYPHQGHLSSWPRHHYQH